MRARRLNAMRRQPLNMRRRLPPVPVCRRERVFLSSQKTVGGGVSRLFKKVKAELEAFPDLLFRLDKLTNRLKRFVWAQTEKFGGESAEALLARCRKNVVYIDKLSELLKKLDREFFKLKREKICWTTTIWSTLL